MPMKPAARHHQFSRRRPLYQQITRPANVMAIMSLLVEKSKAPYFMSRLFSSSRYHHHIFAARESSLIKLFSLTRESPPLRSPTACIRMWYRRRRVMAVSGMGVSRAADGIFVPYFVLVFLASNTIENAISIMKTIRQSTIS